MTETKNDTNVVLFPGNKISAQNSVTFKQAAFEWLFEEKQGGIQSRTLEWYYLNIKRYLFPILENSEINEIDFDFVLGNLKSMARKKSRTTQICANLFKRIMEYSIEEGYLTHSMPLHKLKTIRYNTKLELKYIPQHLRKIVLNLAADHEIFYPILIVSMFLGLRPGELIALTWDNINFKTGFINIIEAVTYEVTIDEDGVHEKVAVIGDTKTAAGVRQLKAPDIVLQALIIWRFYCIKKGFYSATGLVFVTRKGEMRSYSGLRSLFRRFSEKHSEVLEGLNIIPKMPRHTCATMMLENGVNPKIAQKVLGHSDVKTTLSIYSHVSNEVLVAVAIKMDNIYSSIINNVYIPKV